MATAIILRWKPVTGASSRLGALAVASCDALDKDMLETPGYAEEALRRGATRHGRGGVGRRVFVWGAAGAAGCAAGDGQVTGGWMAITMVQPSRTVNGHPVPSAAWGGATLYAGSPPGRR